MQDNNNDIIVWQKNELIEMRDIQMTPIEAKIFEFYLAAIDYRKPKSAHVKLYLEEYKKMTGRKDVQIKDMMGPVTSLYKQSILIPGELDKPHNGIKKGFIYAKLRHLFDTCDIAFDNLGRPYIDLKAHRDVLPLMFEWKPKNFTRYRLSITLSLASFKQIQLYKILKQNLNDQNYCFYETPISELKDRLGVKPEEYDKLEMLRKFLNGCQNAFEEKTDIKFTYEKGKSGKKKTWASIIFYIFRNDKNYVDTRPKEKESSPKKSSSHKYTEEELKILREACQNAFSDTEMDIILAKMERIKYPKDSEPPYIKEKESILKEQYLILLDKEVVNAAKGEKIENRGAYFIKMIENLCTIANYRIF